MQTKLIPTRLNLDSIQIPTGEGNLAFMTYWSGVFTIELLMFDIEEEE